MSKFVECKACAAKTGSPILCSACLANRKTIADLENELRMVKPPSVSVSAHPSDGMTIGDVVCLGEDGEWYYVNDETQCRRKHGS